MLGFDFRTYGCPQNRSKTGNNNEKEGYAKGVTLIKFVMNSDEGYVIGQT